MGVTVKRATLWRTETRNSPGMLARTLHPLAGSHTDLQIVIGYAYPDRQSAAIEVYPVESRPAKAAAMRAGLTTCDFPCLVVTGDNRPGLSYEIANSLSEAGINLNFFIAQKIGKQYTALFGFEAQSEADLAAQLIRKATAKGAKSGVARKRLARRRAS
jgi:hypothetical protein